MVFCEGATWPLLARFTTRRVWVRVTGPAGSALKSRVQRALLPLMSAVSAPNPALQAGVVPPGARQRDLPYPVDVAFWSERVNPDPSFWSGQGLDVPAGPVLTVIAQLVAVKRQVAIVEGLAPFLRERPDARLVLAGREVDPQVAIDLRAAIERLCLADQVLLLGGLSRTELRMLHAHTAASIIFSESETQCMALYELLAARVPVAISDIPSLTLAFPKLPASGDGPGLLAAVRGLVDDPADADSRVAASQDRVQWADEARHDRVFREALEQWGIVAGPP